MDQNGWELAEFDVCKPWEGQMTRVSITGHVKGGLAVHLSISTEIGGWTLSHLATGARMFGNENTASECRAAGEAVLLAVPDFGSLGSFGDIHSVDSNVLKRVGEALGIKRGST